MNDKPYYYVRAWCSFMCCSTARVVSQVELARQEDAPESALYRTDNGWTLLEHIEGRERRSILTNMVLIMKMKG